MNPLVRFILWWLKNPAKRTFSFLAISLHLAMIWTLSISSPHKKKPKKLIVKTITIQNPAPKIAMSNSNAKVTTVSSPTKPTPKPTPKKPVKKIEKKAPPPQKKTEAPEKKRKTIDVSQKKSTSEQRLKEIEERIAKIAEKNDRMSIKSELTVPKTVELTSSLDSFPSNRLEEVLENEDYAMLLIGYLQGYLQLPDVGEVKMQVNLRKDGSVETMKVVYAESSKNKKYLEENLPTLAFPQLPKDSPRSFLITFCNKT